MTILYTRRWILGLILLVTTAATAPMAQQRVPPGATADIPRLVFEKYTLPNGLDIILSEDKRLPMVAVSLWYHVGPANEVRGLTGFAHLFEHMMFQGSRHVPPDTHFKFLESAGASDINGTTDFDRTNYFETLPSSQLELALWLESDRMGYLLDKLDAPQLANQQDVVRNERRQSVENRPYGIADEAVAQTLFPPDHPYYANVIGSHEDIQAAKLDDVKRFFKLYYTPNNASLAIVGDFDKAQAKALVAKYFGTLKRGAPVPPITAVTPKITQERRKVVTDRVELPRIYLTWITSPIYKPGDADADIAATILGGGKSSRLYKRLVYDKQIAQNVSAQQYSLTLGSMFQIDVTARPGHTAEELEKAVDEELDKFRASPPDAAEVDRARNTIETRIVTGLETLGGFGGVADRLNMYNHFLGTPDYLQKDIQRYRAVTPASVQTFASDQLKNSARVVVQAVPGEKVLGPQVATPPPGQAKAGEGTESINVEEAWRNELPKGGPSRALQLATPDSMQLANGLTVVLSPRAGLPVVAANLVVRTGSDANPLDKPGLANFTAAMIDEGTATRSSLQIADQLAQLGATLGTRSTMDATFVQGGSLKKNFGQTLELMADVTLHPAFPADEIERQRASRLAQLVQQRENAGQVAASVTATVLYGERHPYGFTEIGTEAAVKAVSRAEMETFWKQNFVPGNAALVVAGDITMAELKPLAEKAFGGWPSRNPGQDDAWQPRHRHRACGDRRQAGGAANRAARRRHRRAAIVAGFPGDSGDEHGARRIVLQPHQHEPARGARVHLRRQLAVRVPPIGRAVRHRRRRPHRRHRSGGDRDPEGSARDGRQADERRRAAAVEGCPRPIAAGCVRDERERRRQLFQRLHLRPRARLLHPVSGARRVGDDGAGAGGGEEVSGAGEADRCRCRRPREDRAGAAEAQPRDH